MHRITRFILIAMFLLLVSISSVFADQEYVVLPGDTLYRIAIRFGVPMSAIAEANNITNYNLIIAGQVLTIPDSSDPTTPTTPPPATDTPTPPATETYTVQYGDTLGAIARRFNTTVSAIAQENNILNPNLIRVGQVLKIPGTNGGTTPTPTPTPPPDSNPTPTPSPTPNVPSDLTYVVRSGDTLGSIAARFGVSLRDLSTLNRISNPNLIYVGQVLQIPDPLDTDDPVVITPPPAEDTPPPNTVDTSGFVLGGQVLAFDRVSEMNSAGMTWAKRQIHWTQGQSASDFQGVIDEAKSKGFKVLLSVIGQPGQLANNPDQYYQEFAAFLGDLAVNGADGIEVWNEMNIDREWPRGLISGTEYTKMLRAAYLAIKDKNTGTLVVSGAPAPTGFFNGCTVNGCDDDLFIRQMAVAGAANYMDCVGIHYNSGITPPSATSGAPVGSSSHYSWYYPSMITLYSNSFVGEPLCFTELGYLTGEGFPPLPAGFSWASGTTLSNQADWLGQAVRMARTQYTNIYLIIVWNVDAQVYDTDPQAGYAIVRPDGSCPACGTLASAMQ